MAGFMKSLFKGKQSNPLAALQENTCLADCVTVDTTPCLESGYLKNNKATLSLILNGLVQCNSMPQARATEIEGYFNRLSRERQDLFIKWIITKYNRWIIFDRFSLFNALAAESEASGESPRHPQAEIQPETSESPRHPQAEIQPETGSESLDSELWVHL